MLAPAYAATIPSAEPPGLEDLHAAISDAIAALVAWDITALQSAVDRQTVILRDLPHPSSQDQVAEAMTARKIQELNRVYDRLLQHSVHWTRTIQSILQASGHTLPNRATVHFRG